MQEIKKIGNRGDALTERKRAEPKEAEHSRVGQNRTEYERAQKNRSPSEHLGEVEGLLVVADHDYVHSAHPEQH